MYKESLLWIALGLGYLLISGFQPPHITFPVEYTKTITYTERFNPVLTEMDFNVEIANLDDCTYQASKNGDIIFRAKVTIVRGDGSRICQINEPLSHRDSQNSIRFLSIRVNKGEEIHSDIDLVAFPKESDTCFGPPLNCTSRMPQCCFSFTCCDCAQWDGILQEGFWITNRLTSVMPTSTNVTSATHQSNMQFAYPPHTPYPNYASSPFSKGCVCCGH